MKPLSDVRIIAIEQFGAGPFGSVQLADLGADVIKIEDPVQGGDVGRYVVPHQDGSDSLFFQTFNRNKRSLVLNIETTGGRKIFEDLVRISDVVYSNLRGDVPSRLKICYSDLSHLNEKIVCVSLSGYGINNTRSKKPGYDYLLQGETGWMSLTGEVGGPPAKSGLSLVDFAAGYVAAMTILAGVHGARKSGVGMDCDLSLYDVALNLLTYPATWFLTAGEIPLRQDRSSHPSIVPFQNFPTATEWIVLGCAKEKFWENLTIAIERPDLKNDERFNSFTTRKENKKELIEILDKELSKKAAHEWISILESNNVPCARIQTIPQALSDPFASERGLIVEVPHPRWGVVKQIRTPVNIGDMSENEYKVAPELNADAKNILDLIGYSKEEIKKFADSGAFGSEILNEF